MPVFTLSIQVTTPPGTEARDLPIKALGEDARLVGWSKYVPEGESQVVAPQGHTSSKVGDLGG